MAARSSRLEAGTLRAAGKGEPDAITERAHERSEAKRRAGAAYASLVGQWLVFGTRVARGADTEGTELTDR